MKFSKLPPLAKIGIWIVLIVAIAAVVQSIATVCGLPFNILSNSGGGRGVLLAIALASLLAMIAADKRPISDFGLFVGPRWKKLWLGGLITGLMTMLAYTAATVASGAVRLNFDSLSAARCAKALMSAMTVFPLALAQQILFSGYMLSMLRERYQRVTAVLVSALLFAVLGRMNQPQALLQLNVQSLLIGLFLVATLLGTLRLLTGNIILPAGLLAGWLFVRRLSKKMQVLVPVEDSPLLPWLAPHNDGRQAPVMWLFLGLGITACWYVLRKKGEGEVPQLSPSLDTDFKRVFPLSNGNALTPLDIWIGRLWKARFRVGIIYVPRLLAVLVCSTVNTILSLPERLIVPLLVRNREVPDPVFIVGIQRSGTTHLHNLMALDPQFSTPRLFHIVNPFGYLSTGWLLAPLLAAFMPWKRPMDSVRMHYFAAQEDEFLIVGSSRMSPFWGMSFPKMWSHYDRYLFVDQLPAAEREQWKRHLMFLLRKLTWFNGKSPVIKNPNHTPRVKALREMFPKARFVHLHRHPYDVYRSNLHLANEGHIVYQLQDQDPSCSYQTRFLTNYRAMEESYYRETAGADGQACDVAYDDLDRDPIGQVKRIYATLGLEFTEAFAQRLDKYVASLAGYQKNRHRDLPEEDRCRIEEVMHPLMKRWGYESEALDKRAA